MSKKRTCGTCRFFQEAGLAGSGWCHHPQRKPNSDAKIMVRRGELPCRDGWSRDLWSPKIDEKAAAADLLLPVAFETRPEPPITEQEMTAVVNSQLPKPDGSDEAQAGSPSRPIDVVVGEVPVMRTSDDRAALLANSPRAAIIKARERYREKLVTPTRPGETAPVSGDPSTTPRGDRPEQTVPPPYPREVPPVQRSEMPRHFPEMTTFPDEDARFTSVPDRLDGFSLPRPEPVDRPTFIAGADGDVSDDDASSRDALITPPMSVEVFDQESRTQPAPAGTDRFETEYYGSASAEGEFYDEAALETDEVERGRSLSERIVGSDRRRGLSRHSWPGRRRAEQRTTVFAETEPEYYYDEPGLESASASASASELDFEREPALDFESESADFQSADAVFPPSLPVAGLTEVGDDELDMTVQVAPHVPRMCRTCRDFRPADSGERGWCNNKWAFSHRRMVDVDELPCETSLGCWWLPHDDVWLASADIVDHSAPTPLVEHWLTQREGIEGPSGSPVRQRQRS